MSKYFQQSIIITILYIVLRAKNIVCFFTLQRWKQVTDKLQGRNRPETNHQEHSVDVAPEIKPVTTRATTSALQTSLEGNPPEKNRRLNLLFLFRSFGFDFQSSFCFDKMLVLFYSILCFVPIGSSYLSLFEYKIYNRNHKLSNRVNRRTSRQ